MVRLTAEGNLTAITVTIEQAEGCYSRILQKSRTTAATVAVTSSTIQQAGFTVAAAGLPRPYQS